EMEAQWKEESERIGMLSYVLLGTVKRWWEKHQENLLEWHEVIISLSFQFSRNNTPATIKDYH
ncbi:hypothetical protein KI387_036402, partial [Taxus chinensis]